MLSEIATNVGGVSSSSSPQNLYPTPSASVFRTFRAIWRCRPPLEICSWLCNALTVNCRPAEHPKPSQAISPRIYGIVPVYIQTYNYNIQHIHSCVYIAYISHRQYRWAAAGPKYGRQQLRIQKSKNCTAQREDKRGRRLGYGMGLGRMDCNWGWPCMFVCVCVWHVLCRPTSTPSARVPSTTSRAPFPGSQQHRHPTMSSAIVCASFGNKLQQANNSS